MPTRVRLDALLTDRGLFRSRSRAAAAVLAGDVRIGTDGRRAEKPGQMVDPEAELLVEERREYVSRGGVKLANALDALGVDVRERLCIDVGASTGGFTDCLLRRGAEAVVCVDVGYGELDWSLRSDERVTVLERTNARALEPEMLPFRPTLAVIDVSFISLEKVLPAVAGCLDTPFDCLALVKPQFEVGKERVGSGGVVREADDRRAALVGVGEAALAMGLSVVAYAPSGLPGPAGNRESFVWIAEPGRRGAAEDLVEAARRAEP